MTDLNAAVKAWYEAVYNEDSVKIHITSKAQRSIAVNLVANIKGDENMVVVIRPYDPDLDEDGELKREDESSE